MQPTCNRCLRQYDKACEAYENASRTSAMYLEPLRKMAEVYAETGNTAKRLECLERLGRLSPLNVERKLTLGEIYLQMNRPENARKIFDQAMTLSDREATEYTRAWLFAWPTSIWTRTLQTAVAFLQRGLEAKRGFWGTEDLLTFNRVGILLRRAGKWREAAEEYLKALKVAPNDENLHYNLSMAYLEGKDFESARASTVKALALNRTCRANPRSSPATWLRSLCGPATICTPCPCCVWLWNRTRPTTRPGI